MNSFLWTGIGLPLNNPPYTVQFFDADELSADDLIDTVVLPSQSGNHSFSESGTQGVFTVGNQVLESFYNEEVVTVFPLPEAEFQFVENDSTLIFSDSTLTSFYWFLNGQQIPDQSDSVLVLENPGVYTAVVENIYGCTATSEEFILCPDPQIQFDEETNQLWVTDGFQSYQWFLDGLPIDGETNNTLTPVSEGNYAVEITTSYGCEVLSEVFILGVDELQSQVEFSVFPNPSEGSFNLAWKSNLSEKLNVLVFDSRGSQVFEKQFNHSGIKSIFKLGLSDFPSGIYMLQIKSNRGIFHNKVVLR